MLSTNFQRPVRSATALVEPPVGMIRVQYDGMALVITSTVAGVFGMVDKATDNVAFGESPLSRARRPDRRSH